MDVYLKSMRIDNVFNYVSLQQILITTVIILPIIYYYNYYKNRYNHWQRHGIKGPAPIPFIGNWVPFTKPQPIMQMEEYEKYGDFYGIYRGTTPGLVISNPEVIKRILVKDFHLFRNRNEPIRSSSKASLNLASACDESWKRIRSILSPMFTTSKLRKMERLMSQCIDSLISAMNRLADNNESFLVHGVMGNFTMDVIAKCAFATDTNAHSDNENQFVKNARAMFEINIVAGIARLMLPQWLFDFLFKINAPYFRSNSRQFFEDISNHLIKQRRNNPNIKYDDMLELMIKAEYKSNASFMDDEDKFDSHHVNVGEEEKQQEQQLLSNITGSKYLSEDEIIAQCFVFFIAGYETTASTLTYCLYELVKNPEKQTKLFDEIKQMIIDQNKSFDYENVMRLPYLDAVISETLRMHPPALALTRIASESYHIPECNYTMSKGEMIRIPTYAIHHNAKFFPEPEKFIPERFMDDNRKNIIPYTYLPFGGGPRNCIGMRFALSEAKLGLARMISKFEFFKSKDTVDELKIENSFILLKTVPIYVGVRHRKST